MGRVEAEDLSRGQNSVVWNGKQLDGIKSVKDDYTIEVRAWDTQMSEFKGETKAVGLVSGVSFEDGETVLQLTNGKQVFLKDVNSFNAHEPSKQNDVTQKKMPGLKKQAQSSYNRVGESL